MELSRRRFLARTMAVALTVAAALTAGAQRARWQYLGEANVDGAVDHDKISVSGNQGPFRAIQIHVERAPIRFDRVIVNYGNGTSAPIQMRSIIHAGGKTRVIDLPGDRRYIRNVEFYYARAVPGSAKPKVRLYGLL